MNLAEKNTHAVVHNCEIDDVNFFVDAYSVGDRTRSFLKVQDGCDYSCTFCTIPLARGTSRSDTIDNVIANAKKIAATGVKEIVLTGVNIGDFGHGKLIETDGRKKREFNFFDLVKALDKVEGVERFRISSIEPNLLSTEIIEFVSKSKRFVPHFHIPLQSGSNSVLKRMKRRYLRELYAERGRIIKTLMPNCCIGVDVLVGFPGETEEEFKETYDFLNELDISYLHVFTYSERANTPAAEMKDPVPMSIRKQRNKMLRILSAKKLRDFYQKNIGTTHSVLFENEQKDNFMQGFTENYVKVKLPYDPAFVNQLTQITITGFDDDGVMKGELVSENISI
ncbi:MAG: MiaB/RimO family radical SAM methylthiotransferase [Sphingobacteriaceae bacterium]